MKKSKRSLLKLIKKFLDGSISTKDRDKLYFFFLNNQKIITWPDYFTDPGDVEQKIFARIKAEISNPTRVNRRGVIPFYKKRQFKYGVAASFLLLAAVTLFIKHNDNSLNLLDTRVVVQKTVIKPGTDKATLTLEDGTLVDLQKEENYVSKNLRNNGQDLVYKSGKNYTSKVSYNYLTIPRGGQYHLILADSTVVWLNSESRIKYPVAFVKGKTREVELIYGEVYFDVSSSTKHNGTSFKVISQGQEIQVLGTEFNVKAYRNESRIYTTLVEGSVAFKTPKSLSVLKVGQQAVLNTENSFVTIADVNTYYETAWKKGLFAFKNKSLKEIMMVLSRWYDVDIVFEDKKMENIEFKGVIRKDQKIEEILVLIKNIHIINAYEIKNKTITIKN